MIPKKIHYCWFGGKPLPKEYEKYISSWRHYFPEYEVIEWNEQNFDFRDCDYASEAYEKKKWAFVSDYARFKILYENGGVYFDVDVEVINTMDDIINNGAFMGFERKTMVAPGLGLGAKRGEVLYKEMIDLYKQESFVMEDNELNQKTVVEYMTEVLVKHGLILNGQKQTIKGITIYPVDYFCPMNYKTGEIALTNNTRTIHHYAESWHTPYERLKNKIKRMMGPKLTQRLVSIKHLLAKVGKK